MRGRVGLAGLVPAGVSPPPRTRAASALPSSGRGPAPTSDSSRRASSSGRPVLPRRSRHRAEVLKRSAGVPSDYAQCVVEREATLLADVPQGRNPVARLEAEVERSTCRSEEEAECGVAGAVFRKARRTKPGGLSAKDVERRRVTVAVTVPPERRCAQSGDIHEPRADRSSGGLDAGATGDGAHAVSTESSTDRMPAVGANVMPWPAALSSA